MKVAVLLSTYNGEKYLREQLDSLFKQTISVFVLVRDDGSTDSTREILEEYKNQRALNWYGGKNLRSAKSFWDLLANAPEAEYYAFCDQDDVWFEDKIERALNALDKLKGDAPLLYCSNALVADENLRPLGNLIESKKIYTDFAHSLVYSLAPGCTFVFNNVAKNEMLKYDMDANSVIIHDWLAHKIISMLGRVIYDNEPTIFYRQHGNNVIGAQKKGIAGFFKRIKRFLNGSSAFVRSENAKSLLSVYRNQIDAEAADTLKMVAHYRTDKKLKRKFIKCKQFKIDMKNNVCLKILIRLNKV